MKFKKGLIVAAVLAGSGGVYAQSTSADFVITGSITATPCLLSVVGGAVDLGTLTSTYVNSLTGGAGGDAALPGVKRTLTVTCDAPQTVAVALEDVNVANKLAPFAANPGYHSLVNTAQANAPIGTFRIFEHPNYASSLSTVDGQPRLTILESAGVTGTPAAWVAYTGGSLKSGYSYSWLTTVGTVPAAFTTANIGLAVIPYLDKTSVNAQLATGAITSGPRSQRVRMLQAWPSSTIRRATSTPSACTWPRVGP